MSGGTAPIPLTVHVSHDSAATVIEVTRFEDPLTPWDLTLDCDTEPVVTSLEVLAGMPAEWQAPVLRGGNGIVRLTLEPVTCVVGSDP